ncbi:MAG TPA: hypothetical protein VL200_09400 [Lacunisphaera sp.]|nr:hypothetical protein [Lacunisphaera sp.]
MKLNAPDITNVGRDQPIPLLAQRGSLILLVMCLLAVLGITLASYLAVANNSMKLSNRSFQTSVSRQLAELGLVEALRAFNANDWTTWTANGATATWSTSGTTANCTISFSFPATKFGNTVNNASVKIRVDNYNARVLGSTYSSTATYRVNDLVGSGGIWYRAITNGFSGQVPTNTGKLRYWVPEPVSWLWASGVSYAVYSLVSYNGQWFRCHTAHTSSGAILPTNTSYWSSIPITSSISLSYDVSATYSRGAMVFSNGTWYYSINGLNTGNTPPNPTWWAALPTPVGDTWSGSSSYSTGDYVYFSNIWYRYTNTASWAASSAPYLAWMYRSGATYSFNDVVYYSTSGAGTWYRCKVSSSSNVPTNTSDWEDALSGSMHAWDSGGINYRVGDVAYYGATGQWYRCILAHTSSGSILPSNSTYWATDPRYYNIWDSGKQYSQNDTVRFNGVWYRYINSSPSNGNIPTNTTYWIGANTSTASYQWNATTAYSAGDYRCYGGVWYKCTTANTGQSPNNSSYWTASWANSWGITTGAPVIYTQSSVSLPDGTAPLSTELRTTIFPAPLFPNAVAANSTISANSGGTVDSYDGSVSSMSTGGIYSTYTYNQNTSPFSAGSPNLGYSAVLAASYTAGTAITLSSTSVKGYLAAPSSANSPYAPLYSSGGSVKGASSPASPNIDLTQISRSPYIPQFDTIPGGANGLTTYWSTTAKGMALVLSSTTSIGTPGATTPARYYVNGNLVLSSSTGYYSLNIIGPVILYINGDLIMDSGPNPPNGKINIYPAGSAEIHVAGRLTVNLGSDGINNLTLDPKKLIIICDTNASSVQNYSDATTASVYGVFYLPYTTNTSGLLMDNNLLSIYGAVSANRITYSGANMNIHYDTSLRYTTFGGVDQPYAITEWRELTDPSEQVTLP